MKTAFYLRSAGMLTALLWTVSARAELKVATLHPLLTDLAHQVGGASVTVQAVVAPGTDMHHFSPSPADVKKLGGSTLVLASGKNLENYLGKLKDNLTADQEMVEVGATIPSLSRSEAEELVEDHERRSDAGGQKEEKGKEDDHAHDHDHDHGGVDPHWWNSVENMQRAAKVLAAAFSKKDPANAAKYEANASAYSKKLGELKKWARREIARIPAERRKLATSHLALSYFAKEFGFRLIPVQGMNPEVPATSKDLAAAMDTIRKNKITAVFPEQGVNPKHLTELSRETGVKFGGELIADGNGTGELATFTGAFEHNVNEIVKALGNPAPKAPVK